MRHCTKMQVDDVAHTHEAKSKLRAAKHRAVHHPLHRYPRHRRPLHNLFSPIRRFPSRPRYRRLGVTASVYVPIIAPNGHYRLCPHREHDFPLHLCPDGHPRHPRSSADIRGRLRCIAEKSVQTSRLRPLCRGPPVVDNQGVECACSVPGVTRAAPFSAGNLT